MSKEKVKIEGIAIKCDKCGCYYETGGEGIFYPDYHDENGEQIEEEALEDGWIERNGKHYCPECKLSILVELNKRNMKEVIEGWIAQDKDNWEPPCLFVNKPTWDEEGWEYGDAERWRDKEYRSVENEGGIILPESSFPDLKFENSPRKVKITIETID